MGRTLVCVDPSDECFAIHLPTGYGKHHGL